MHPKAFYFQRIQIFQTQVNESKGRLFKYSIARFVVALGIGVGVLYSLRNPNTLGLWLLAAAVVFFIYLIKKYNQINQAKSVSQQLLRLNQDEIKILDGIYGDKMSPDVDATHPYAHDLDIVGTYSLFSQVDRTCSPKSTDQLLSTLCFPIKEKEKITERQKAIQDLTNRVAFRQNFMAIGNQFQENGEDAREFLNWLSGTGASGSGWGMRLISLALCISISILLISALLEQISHNYWMILFGINLTFLSMVKKRGGAIPQPLANKIQYLSKYSGLLEWVSNEDFRNGYIQHATQKSGLATTEFKKLIKILKINRANNFVTQGLILPDLHLLAAAEKWRKNNGKEVANWLEGIYLLDELNSFANFAYNFPEFTYPTFSEKDFVKAEGLGHPFLYSKNAVTNSFLPDSRAVVLTGANMSGKSTFLRSVGINLVLAYAGAPVFARKFECRIAAIFTSMRISDDLENNSSYFFAELGRLSTIMDQLRQEKPVIILLDEVLKGTNSEDKLEGSIGLVKGFSSFDCFSIIATHDLGMGKLESQFPGLVSNYCFESELTQSELHFDFKIRKGLAINKNASFLMRRMNLIE